jgi:hypothetical protein
MTIYFSTTNDYSSPHNPGVFTPATAIIPAGSNYTTARYTDTTLGEATVHASGVNVGSNPVIMNIDAIRFGLSIPSTDLTAGKPSNTVALRIYNQHDLPVQAPISLPITLSGPGSASFTPASITMPYGSTSANFTFTDNAPNAGWTAIYASSPNVGQAYLSYNIASLALELTTTTPAFIRCRGINSARSWTRTTTRSTRIRKDSLANLSRIRI